MFKLLVDTPQNTQEIILIESNGKYFDVNLVVWDERADGTLPAITLGGMVRSGNALVFDQTRKDQHDAVIAARQAEQDRLNELETAVKTDTIVNQLKAMTDAQYSAWFDANVTTAAQSIQLLKRLTRVIIRKVL